MSTHTPRVLFLTSSAFNKVTGGGITFSNLFTGWPKNAIATVHNDTVPVSHDICQQYYRLSEREIHRWGWLKYIPMGKANTVVTDQKVAAPTGKRFFFQVFKRIKTLVFGDAIPEVAKLSPELERWILDFKPTVLYTILGSNAMMDLAEQIRVRFGLPLVVHIMDDWASVVYHGGILSCIQRRKKDVLLQHLMNVATSRMAICDAMASAYEQRYQQPFVAFQNTIDVATWQHYEKKEIQSGVPVRVAYIGSILPFAQLDSLIDICQAIQGLSEEGVDIRLEIYSPTFNAAQYANQLLVGNAISLQDTIQDDGVFFATLQSVDILVLPVNFDSYTKRYIRYSMPTKVPAYLTIGTPILAYGPSDVAQISYAQTAGWGMTVTSRSPVMLRDAIKRLSTDHMLRTQLSEQAKAYAKANHDSLTVRHQFQACLSDAEITAMHQ